MTEMDIVKDRIAAVFNEHPTVYGYVTLATVERAGPDISVNDSSGISATPYGAITSSHNSVYGRIARAMEDGNREELRESLLQLAVLKKQLQCEIDKITETLAQAPCAYHVGECEADDE